MRHDRPVDRRPASVGCTNAGQVLRGDVSGANEVGVQSEAAIPAAELGLGATIVAIDAPTTRAGLRGVSRVHSDHDAAFLLGLVGKEGAQLGEAPAVDTAVLFTFALFDPCADVLEVFHDDDAAGGDGVDDLPTELVVQVAPEPKLFALQPSDMPTGRTGAFGLQGTTEPKVPCFELAPAALPEEFVVRRNGRADKAEVHANNLAGGPGFRCGHVYDNVQPELVASLDQVGGADLIPHVLLRVGGNAKGNPLAPLRRGQDGNPLCPLDGQGVVIQPGRATLASRTSYHSALEQSSQRRFDSLGCLDPRLDVQVRDEVRVRDSEWIVHCLVKADAVPFSLLPAVGTDGIEDSGELVESFRQCGHLFRRRTKQQANGPVHRLSSLLTLDMVSFGFSRYLRTRIPSCHTLVRLAVQNEL